ncbi:hypothetical protein TNCV_2570071 [Trichonephila clavipes]|nr:hypothetical protein TNCV_2570071 [Trichonephila clavipes]
MKWTSVENCVEFLSKEMPDIKIDENGLFEEERRLNAYLNSNKLEQLENQHAEIDKKMGTQCQRPGSSPGLLKTPRVEAPMHIKYVLARSPEVGVVGKVSRVGFQLRGRPSLLTKVQNWSVFNSPRAALGWDVVKQSFT